LESRPENLRSGALDGQFHVPGPMVSTIYETHSPAFEYVSNLVKVEDDIAGFPLRVGSGSKLVERRDDFGYALSWGVVCPGTVRRGRAANGAPGRHVVDQRFKPGANVGRMASPSVARQFKPWDI